MNVAVTGATGLIGSALVAALEARGHQVVRLVRRAPKFPTDRHFDPLVSALDEGALEGFDAVIHLAGETIAQRWTKGAKERIWRSRVVGAHMLVRAISKLERRPKVFISASAVGYYGPRDDEVITEEEGPGTGFLARLCQEWEEATAAASQLGVRVAVARLGIVLSAKGGALGRMLPLFRRGLGAVLGSGEQYVSWVAIDDVVDAFLWLLEREDMSGPFNVTAPEPVRFKELAQTLARVLGRPAFLRVPAPLLLLLMGEMAKEALLSGQRVVPQRLTSAGFQFRFPQLEGALRHLLGQP